MLGSLNITGTSGYSEGIRIKGVGGISSIWFNAVSDSGYDPKMYGLTVGSAGLRFRYGTGSTPSDIASIDNAGNVTATSFLGKATSAGNADTANGQKFNWTNTSNSPTYLWATNANGTAFLASRANISVKYATSAGSASSSTTAAHLPTAYIGGVKSNPQTYFNNTVGLKVAMTGVAGS